MFSMQRNGTQKARSASRIVTTIKNYKEVSFKNKREEREICINSEESHFYLDVQKDVPPGEKQHTCTACIHCKKKLDILWFYVSEEYQPAMYKAMEDSVEEEIKGILCCV